MKSTRVFEGFILLCIVCILGTVLFPLFARRTRAMDTSVTVTSIRQADGCFVIITDESDRSYRLLPNLPVSLGCVYDIHVDTTNTITRVENERNCSE